MHTHFPSKSKGGIWAGEVYKVPGYKIPEISLIPPNLRSITLPLIEEKIYYEL